MRGQTAFLGMARLTLRQEDARPHFEEARQSEAWELGRLRPRRGWRIRIKRTPWAGLSHLFRRRGKEYSYPSMWRRQGLSTG